MSERRASNFQRITIVGNGNSPTGRGWGQYIDDSDYVIRMWDCWWQKEDDYGKQYDAGVISMSPTELIRVQHWVKRSEFRQPGVFLGKATHIISPTLFNKYISPLMLIMDRDELTLRAKELVQETGKLKLTRGCLAICQAILSMRPNTIMLVGFDNLREGVGTPNAPGNDALWEPGEVAATHSCDGKQKINRHDCLAEQRLIAELAAEHSVTVFHAQDRLP